MTSRILILAEDAAEVGPLREHLRGVPGYGHAEVAAWPTAGDELDRTDPVAGIAHELYENLSHHQAFADAALELRLLEAAVDQARDAIVVTEAGLAQEARIRWCNLAFCALVEMPRADLLGQILVDLPALEHVRRTLTGALGRSNWEGTVQLGRGEDERFLEARVGAVEGGALPRHVAVLRDITEKRKVEERLVHLAHHDVLTGLPNRKLLRDRLENAVTRARRYQERVGILFVDLDGFKRINDNTGHDAGDRVLQVVAERLRAHVRASDTVARIGGDEFVLLLPGIGSIQNAERVATKILPTVSQSIRYMGHELAVTPSVGIALFPDHGRDTDELLRHADQAMYQAKAQGKARFVVWDPACSAEEQERAQMVSDLALAIQEEALDLWAIPIYDAGTSTIRAIEVQARWNHPVRGRVPTTTFTPLLADTGVEGRFWAWMAERAATVAIQRGWSVCLDIRPGWLTRETDVRQGLSALANTPLARASLWLEIAENALTTLDTPARERLRELRELGVRVVVDHFGTGHLSVPQLRSLPIDAVKLDASLVRRSQADDALVRGMATLCHSLGLEILAEGVADPDTRTTLVQAGVQLQQGPWWGAAAPIDQATAENDWR